MRATTIRAFIAAALAGGALPQFALAQPAGIADLEEVIVTATKRPVQLHACALRVKFMER